MNYLQTFFFLLSVSPHRQLRELRSSSVTGRGSTRGSVGSLSPNLSSSGSPHVPNRSPAGIKRRPASFHARTSRTPRPNELKVTPFSRMLNTPTSVDSLPRLRRFTSSQTQLCSFAYLGHDEGPACSKSQEDKEEATEPKDEEEEEEEGAGTARHPTREAATEKDDERGEGKKRSEVLCQPVSERSQGTGAISVKAGTQERKDLVEVSLSEMKTPGGPVGGQEEMAEVEVEGDAGGDGDDQKMCCGFFFKVTVTLIVLRNNQLMTYLTLSFSTIQSCICLSFPPVERQDDVKGEEDMAAKKAALLQKRLRRERETQEKRQQQEQDQEQKKEAARSVFIPLHVHKSQFLTPPRICKMWNFGAATLETPRPALVQAESRGGAAEEGGREGEEGVHPE